MRIILLIGLVVSGWGQQLEPFSCKAAVAIARAEMLCQTEAECTRWHRAYLDASEACGAEVKAQMAENTLPLERATITVNALIVEAERVRACRRARGWRFWRRCK